MAKPKSPCEVLDRIGNELKLLWAQLDAYQELFLVEQDKRAELLALTAPGFFVMVQASLIESLLMRIFRLMDDADIGGRSNCSFAAMRKCLARQPAVQRRDPKIFRLRLCLRQLRKDWRMSGALYDGLKKARNKDLAHNDYTHHSRRRHGQLWLTLNVGEFDLARSLGCRLWHLYRQAKVSICGVDVLEPKPTRLDDRSATVLKQLCSGLYLSRLLEAMPEDAKFSSLAGLHAFEQAKIGEDRIRPVFTNDQGHAS